MITELSVTAIEIVGFLLVAGLCVGFIIAGTVPRFVQRGSTGWITKIGAPIDPQTRALVQQTRGRRQAFAFIGALMGLIAGVILSHSLAERFSPVSNVILLSCLVSGFILGQNLRCLAIVLHPQFDTVRATHARARRVSDFINPVAHTVVWIFVVLIIGLCVAVASLPVWVGTGFDRLNAGPIWLAAGFVLVSAVIAEVAVRRVLNHSMPGAGASSLVWHDALRRELIQDLLNTPLVIGPLVIIMGNEWLSSSGDRSTLGLSFWGLAAYCLAMTVPLVVQHLNRKRPSEVVATS